jgi:hypothetical protein
MPNVAEQHVLFSMTACWTVCLTPSSMQAAGCRLQVVDVKGDEEDTDVIDASAKGGHRDAAAGREGLHLSMRWEQQKCLVSKNDSLSRKE